MTDHRDERGGEAAAQTVDAREASAPPAAVRKTFVEPSVSVPADVLEATALFQAPTIQISIVP